MKRACRTFSNALAKSKNDVSFNVSIKVKLNVVNKSDYLGLAKNTFVKAVLVTMLILFTSEEPGNVRVINVFYYF